MDDNERAGIGPLRRRPGEERDEVRSIEGHDAVHPEGVDEDGGRRRGSGFRRCADGEGRVPGASPRPFVRPAGTPGTPSARVDRPQQPARRVPPGRGLSRLRPAPALPGRAARILASDRPAVRRTGRRSDPDGLRGVVSGAAADSGKPERHGRLPAPAAGVLRRARAGVARADAGHRRRRRHRTGRVGLSPRARRLRQDPDDQQLLRPDGQAARVRDGRDSRRRTTSSTAAAAR